MLSSHKGKGQTDTVPGKAEVSGNAGTPSAPRLFLAFLKLGATSFGGPSMVAYIRRLAVEKKRWLDEGAFLEGVSLCQIIPGATAIQTAAYVGFRIRGIIGAAAAFIGFGLPAFILMMTFSALYARTHSMPTVVSVFNGLQAIVVAIIANAIVSFGRTTLVDGKSVVISLAAAGMFGSGINPIVVIVCSMLLGFLLKINSSALGSKAGQTYQDSKTGLIIILALAATCFAALFFFRRTLFELAALMSVINLFSFGGGFACIPLMLHEVVDVRRWLDSSTFLNGIILGQITPGPIVITATFVGYLSHGPLGGLVATIGMFLPSFLLVVWTAPYFGRLLTSSSLIAAACGSLCSFVGLLFVVGIRFGMDVHWDIARVLLAGSSLLALLLGMDILWVVLFGTIISILVL